MITQQFAAFLAMTCILVGLAAIAHRAGAVALFHRIEQIEEVR